MLSKGLTGAATSAVVVLVIVVLWYITSTTTEIQPAATWDCSGVQDKVSQSMEACQKPSYRCRLRAERTYCTPVRGFAWRIYSGGWWRVTEPLPCSQAVKLAELAVCGL
jgi:hypothetical protein